MKGAILALARLGTNLEYLGKGFSIKIMKGDIIFSHFGFCLIHSRNASNAWGDVKSHSVINKQIIIITVG